MTAFTGKWTLITGASSGIGKAFAERLAKEGQLVAYRHDGFFFAMDTYREFKYLNELWNSGKAPWKEWA